MAKLRFERLRRLQFEERRTADAIYRWTHPWNVEWAKTRDISGSLSLREWCRHLENKVRDLESNRQHVADVAPEAQAKADEQPQADETPATKAPPRISIRWEDRRCG